MWLRAQARIHEMSATPLTSCVTFGQFLNLSESHHSCLHSKNHKAQLMGLLSINDIMDEILMMGKPAWVWGSGPSVLLTE